MDSELSDKVLGHLSNTDGEALVRVAQQFDTAYDRFWAARGRVAGVRADLVEAWDSASGRSIRDFLETVEEGLSQVGATISLVADHLRPHGQLATTTRDDVRQYVLGNYTDPFSVPTSEYDGALYSFMLSEQELTTSLWNCGAIAPGGIPLPEPPPRPPGSWKTFLFGDGYPTGWTWEGGDGPDGFDVDFPFSEFDPDNPFFGYDEWGNRVPAYQAAMPIPMDPPQEAGVGGILKLLAKAGKGAGVTASGARVIAKSADDLAALVRGSYGWRASHIDRHIREWYRLADDAPVPTWMRDEYLRMIVESGTKQGKVFQWSLRGEAGAQPTYSVLRYDQSSGRWLVSQYYSSGSRIGEFATAFQPTARQLARMLQQSAIR